MPDFLTIAAIDRLAALLLGLAMVLCLGAAISDMRRYRIPNSLCLGLMAAGLVWIWASGAPWSGHLIAFAAVLTLGYSVYALGFLGAGDAKLMAVLALWFGPEVTLTFLLHTLIAGGLLALAWILSGPARQALVLYGVAMDPVPPARIPYGVAIAAAALPGLIGLWPAATL